MASVAQIKWSPAVAERVLEVIAETGSPKKAAEAAGVSPRLINYYCHSDPDFGHAYAVATDVAFQRVLGRAFERSLDEEAPSDRLTEVLLKLRFADRFNHMVVTQNTSTNAIGLEPAVIARMAPGDRDALITLLDRYVEAERGQPRLVNPG